MGKPLSFEEWDAFVGGSAIDKRAPHPYDTRKEMVEDWLVKAREGMIPESEAMKIPPVEKWPDRNDDGILVYGVGIVFTTCKDEENFKEMWGECAIKYIPRPAPAWTPKVGDAVFCRDADGWISIERVAPNATGIMTIGPNRVGPMPWAKESVKPFDPAKIGLKWEDI